MPDRERVHGLRRGEAGADRSQRRLRGLRLHMAIFTGLAIAAFVITLLVDPGNPWIVLPLVGWGAVLALHVAWVMGLFDGLVTSRPPSITRKGDRQ